MGLKKKRYNDGIYYYGIRFYKNYDILIKRNMFVEINVEEEFKKRIESYGS